MEIGNVPDFPSEAGAWSVRNKRTHRPSLLVTPTDSLAANVDSSLAIGLAFKADVSSRKKLHDICIHSRVRNGVSHCPVLAVLDCFAVILLRMS